MIQGTASSVGKSLIATGLLRAFSRRGLRVAPFKAQNMALNSVVASDGGEIARAQAVQAEAAGVEPLTIMNPVLLKPETDRRSQVIVMGRRIGTLEAAEYLKDRSALWEVVTQALSRLLSEYELIIVEGAGSPAEVNLREADIANMRVATWLNCPVLLVGDIDRGGVFASLYGTLELLERHERQLVKGTIINKFLGDVSLLREGLDFLKARAGVPVVGVLPYVRDLWIPEEDATVLDHRRASGTGGVLDIALIRLPHISNFDEFDPLPLEKGVQLRLVSSTSEFGSPDLVILPGTKSTIADLRWLWKSGLADRVLSHVREGGALLAICGGMQMLGALLEDPRGIDGAPARARGLALYDGITTYQPDKVVRWTDLRVVSEEGLLAGASGMWLRGYELHNGRTEISSARRPFQANCQGVSWAEGFQDASGWVVGTYVHGLLDNHAFRRRILMNLAMRKGMTFEFGPVPDRQRQYDRWADLIERHLDMSFIAGLVGFPWLR